MVCFFALMSAGFHRALADAGGATEHVNVQIAQMISKQLTVQSTLNGVAQVSEITLDLCIIYSNAKLLYIYFPVYLCFSFRIYRNNSCNEKLKKCAITSVGGYFKYSLNTVIPPLLPTHSYSQTVLKLQGGGEIFSPLPIVLSPTLKGDMH